MSNIHVELINHFSYINEDFMKNDIQNNTSIESRNHNSKMIKNDFFFENDVKICEIITKNIPYYKCYFNLIESIEPVYFCKLRNKNREKYDYINKNDPMDNMFFLVKYLHNTNTDFTSYLFNLNTPKKFISELFFSYNTLINSLIKLNSNNICYFNLCYENIKFSNNTAIIVENFRLSIIKDKLDKTYLKKIIEHTYEYTYKPFEIHLIYYLQMNNLQFLSKDEMKMLSNNFVNSVAIFNIYSHDFKDDYVRKSMQYLEKYINKSVDYIVDDIIACMNSWDNYSVSVLYIHLVGNLIRVFSLKNTFFSKWLNLLTKNIHPDPSKRMTLEETLKKYENLYDENTDWCSINNNFTKEKMKKLYELF